MFFHLFSENFQNVLGPCVSDTALILVNPVYKESRFSSKQTRIKLVPNSSVIPNNLFKMSSPTFCDVVAVRLLSECSLLKMSIPNVFLKNAILCPIGVFAFFI